jgi:DNA-binding beta-propeller fold protein YncE
VEDESNQLVTLDTTTAIGAYVGALGVEDPTGLAFDETRGTLYASDNGTDELLVIDPATGAATAVGALGFQDVEGLAFDPLTATLYGVDEATDQLLTINTSTGVATAVGPVGFDAIRGLDFDTDSGQLYGSDPNRKLLIRIDTLTGAGVAVGTFGPPGIEGLADRPGAGVMYGCNEGAKKLFSVNTSNASTTLIGVYSSPQPGSAYVLDFGEIPATYCTAGSSASGCQALLSASGTPSATAVSGFTLQASTVEGQKDGLFFFGTNGQQASSWGNGTSYQCVVPPVVRAGTLTGSGTPGVCDGSFVQDLNALWCPTCPKPSKNPGGGATVQAQLWYRDPLSTSNQTTSLSDAIEFVMSP